MDPRTRRKQQEQEARRQEILAAAECLFSKNGFFKTSMADIAASSQFAMGTLYRAFAGKEEMYISIVEAKLEALALLLDREIAQATNAGEKIKAFIKVKLDYADRNRDFFRIYVSEWSGFEWTIKSALGERVWKLYTAQVSRVADLIRHGIRRKEFRKIDPEDGALALHGMLNSTTYVWILQEKPTGALVEKKDGICSLFLNGLAREPVAHVARRVV